MQHGIEASKGPNISSVVSNSPGGREAQIFEQYTSQERTRLPAVLALQSIKTWMKPLRDLIYFNFL